MAAQKCTADVKRQWPVWSHNSFYPRTVKIMPVRPSLAGRLSTTRQYSVKTAKHITAIVSLGLSHGSAVTLVFTLA